MKKPDLIINERYLKNYKSIINFINKQVNFRFSGGDLKYFLSRSLFSSFNTDKGSALLLKTIAKNLNIEKNAAVIDVGCGIGTIGLAIKKKYPEIKLYSIDRDALAAAFTELNADLNNIQNCDISGGLGLGEEKEKYDLIVSNLPAKAGNKILEYLIGSFLSALSEDGISAIVIVKTLKEFAESVLRNFNAEVKYREDTKEYSVFHFKGTGTNSISAKSTDATREEHTYSILNYIRNTMKFQFRKTEYNLHTVYNLPDFDTIGYQTMLAMNLLRLLRVSGRALFYNPGQGHLPVFAAKKNDIEEYYLAGRDLLELEITKYNLLEHNKLNTKYSHISCYKELECEVKFDLIVFYASMEWNNNQYTDLFSTLKNILNKYGILIIIAKSTWMHRLLNYKHNLNIINDRKEYGYRGIVLKNKE